MDALNWWDLVDENGHISFCISCACIDFGLMEETGNKQTLENDQRTGTSAEATTMRR